MKFTLRKYHVTGVYMDVCGELELGGDCSDALTLIGDVCTCRVGMCIHMSQICKSIHTGTHTAIQYSVFPTDLNSTLRIN